MVLQYEAVCADPQRHVDEVWRRLRLDPVPLKHVNRPSWHPPSADWPWPEGLEETLTRLYVPDVTRLEYWGVDLHRWPRFSRFSTSSMCEAFRHDENDEGSGLV